MGRRGDRRDEVPLFPLGPAYNLPSILPVHNTDTTHTDNPAPLPQKISSHHFIFFQA